MSTGQRLGSARQASNELLPSLARQHHFYSKLGCACSLPTGCNRDATTTTSPSTQRMHRMLQPLCFRRRCCVWWRHSSKAPPATCPPACRLPSSAHKHCDKDRPQLASGAPLLPAASCTHVWCHCSLTPAADAVSRPSRALLLDHPHTCSRTSSSPSLNGCRRLTCHFSWRVTAAPDTHTLPPLIPPTPWPCQGRGLGDAAQASRRCACGGGCRRPICSGDRAVA